MVLGQVIARLSERPWWDRLVGLASLSLGLLYLTDFHGIVVGRPTAPVWVHVPLLAGMCTAQLWRRRAPMRALAVGVVLFAADIATGLSMPVLIVFVDLLFTATLHSAPRALRWLLRVVIAVVVLLGAAAALTLPDWRSVVFATLNAVTVLIVPVWWAFGVRQHKELAERERRHARELARISELDRKATVAAERARMARDLHDVIAGHLSAIAIQSEAALSMMDSDPAVVRTVLTSVRENSVQSLTEMRAMIEVLRDGQDVRTAPARLAELGRLVASARAGGLTVEVGQSGVDGLPVAVDLAAYRIVQEALTNVLKHAADSSAAVSLSAAGGTLVVEVTNPLVGPPAPVTDGTGLVSMAERAHAVGGSFSAGPCADRWRVRAVLPIGGGR